ncbi:unnamed protein product [Peronospora belbahrii]|uniref:Uncharacterized protein n=1 Tax=Peronospora belbahrii TaxID=622444 RepID=A0AAU9L3D8_9STRA|nr:unnamed protein product [Peronospora belbahrii]CAH0520340.1 unnamed protein product [Peronospora belbahrii]
MDPSCSMRIPRRAQCVLPELTLAPLSSSLAATPHKSDQLYAQQLPDSSNRSRNISRSTIYSAQQEIVLDCAHFLHSTTAGFNLPPD